MVIYKYYVNEEVRKVVLSYWDFRYVGLMEFYMWGIKIKNRKWLCVIE